MDNDLMVVKQLPVIEDRLRQVKDQVEERVKRALSMPCTEETRLAVKAARAALNKEFAELETRRKTVKSVVMAPYEAFEAVYRECVAESFKEADAVLKRRIDDVEAGLKADKETKIRQWFDEYSRGVGLNPQFVNFERSGIKVTLSASEKSLREQAKSFVDRVAAELSTINLMTLSDDDRAALRALYFLRLDLPGAIAELDERKKAVEAQREAPAPDDDNAPLAPPVEKEADELYSTAFRVTGTMGQLKRLKDFLINGGYIYEQL